MSIDLSQINLADLVRRNRVELRQVGNRHVGLCPFHTENTPSFYVYPDKRFHCFGCGAHGDAIEFVRKLHGVGFKEALQDLGIEQGGMTRETPEAIMQRDRNRELVQGFREWEIDASSWLGELIRAARRALAEIRTEEDLERYGDLYQQVTLWEYYLFEILAGRDERAKFELWKQRRRRGRF
ncbi:CHC2 zinc finger domain-containing protein [Thermodesulfobacteriota bacterium]